MATIKEKVTIECRNPEEYYEILQFYKRDGYEVEETEEAKCLNFKASREYKIWELSR